MDSWIQQRHMMAKGPAYLEHEWTPRNMPTFSLLQKKLAMKKARQVSSSRHLSGICLSRKRMDLFTAISSKDLWISLGVHRVGPLSSYIQLQDEGLH